LILLSFFIPVGLYLLILGTINRRRYPLMVSGPWDFAGILFAASGFLLAGGPGALSVLNEHWRDALIFGHNPSDSSATETLWLLWLFLMIVYFIVVVLASGYFLWRARSQTSIYNIEPDTARAALGRVLERLGLSLVRSGDLFYVSRTADRAATTLELSAIQKPSDEGLARVKLRPTPIPTAGLENVCLEIESFRAMWHVTLRWEPSHSGLRQEVENELARELADTPTPNHLLGGWLTLASCALFLLCCLTGFVFVIARVLFRI
jgi:hypothetical protein